MTSWTEYFEDDKHERKRQKKHALHRIEQSLARIEFALTALLSQEVKDHTPVVSTLNLSAGAPVSKPKPQTIKPKGLDASVIGEIGRQTGDMMKMGSLLTHKHVRETLAKMGNFELTGVADDDLRRCATFVLLVTGATQPLGLTSGEPAARLAKMLSKLLHELQCNELVGAAHTAS